jgi:hypothetical protein
VDALGRLLTDGAGGGGGSGQPQPTFYTVGAGATQTVTAPGAVTDQYAYRQWVLTFSTTTGGYTASGFNPIGAAPPRRPTAGDVLVLTAYTTDFGSTWNLVGVRPGESIGTWAWNDLRQLSAASYPGVEALVTGVILDYNGAGSTKTVVMHSANGRWVPKDGSLILRNLAAYTAVSGAAVETLMQSVRFPQGLLGAGDVIRIQGFGTKTGTAGTATVRYRFGNVSDLAETSLGTGLVPATGTHVAFSWASFIRVNSNTQVELLGAGQVAVGDSGGATTAAPTVVTVDDISAADSFLVSSILTTTTDTEVWRGFIVSVDFGS